MESRSYELRITARVGTAYCKKSRLPMSAGFEKSNCGKSDFMQTVYLLQSTTVIRECYVKIPLRRDLFKSQCPLIANDFEPRHQSPSSRLHPAEALKPFTFQSLLSR